MTASSSIAGASTGIFPHDLALKQLARAAASSDTATMREEWRGRGRRARAVAGRSGLLPSWSPPGADTADRGHDVRVVPVAASPGAAAPDCDRAELCAEPQVAR